MIQFGTADGLRGKRAVSAAVAALLDHGTRDLSRQQIQDKLDALQADVHFDGSAGVVVADISSKGNFLPPVNALVLQLVREASFPATTPAHYTRQAVEAIQKDMETQGALA